VVLVNTRNPLNIGAAARAMSNFGFLQLRVVTPYEPSFREARSAVGAASVLAKADEFDSVAAAVADCSLVVGTTAIGHRLVQHPMRRLQEGAELIRWHLASGRVALMFGSEKVGLSNEDLTHCHWLLHIPTGREHTSMNLGQAVAVCLYELAREEAGQVISEASRSASAAEVERLAVVLLEALRTSGYEVPGSAASTGKKVRRFLHRLNLQKTDAELWLGMLRQIVWKLQRKEKAVSRQLTRKAAVRR
jgi:TrmH family RNA methyltransferase